MNIHRLCQKTVEKEAEEDKSLDLIDYEAIELHRNARPSLASIEGNYWTVNSDVIEQVNKAKKNGKVKWSGHA